MPNGTNKNVIPFTAESPIYKPGDIEQVLEMAVNDDMLITSQKGKKVTKLYNVPCSFDIETTSFYKNDEKQAIMYEWTFGINGIVIIGRTWIEFTNMLKMIVNYLNLNLDKRLVIYVHNLSFEFQFIRKRLLWDRVFSVELRKPIYAITTNGIEFRCSYMLSGYALKKLGDELQKYKVAKMVGDLDYSLLRHEKTVLSDTELKYCENDVRVVMAYIQERIEIDGNIDRLPLTKTGYVREYCRNSCLYTGSNHKKGVRKWEKYQKLMKALTLDTDEYLQLKRAFQGGFTHANAYYSEQLLYNVASYDFTSSYPYVMISEKFPMSKGKIINLHSEEEFYSYVGKYCCIFDIRFTNIMSKVTHENPISESRCYNVKRGVINNGRIVQASSLDTTITEQDFAIIKYFYSWDKVEVTNFRVYQREYLPTDFVKSILKLYSDKTTLKGVEGKEIEYLAGKSMLNATYGMAVTDICRDENIYTKFDKWEAETPNIEEVIERYNKDKKRFLFYPWGVWVTAYARRNLFHGIAEFGEDYVYSDTDSVKLLNHERHLDFIEKYNETCKLKLQMACKYHKIPFELVEPMTIKGEKKLMGVWDFEGIYIRFKTLGAKRYMTESDNNISLTVSGVNKQFAIPYLLEKYGHDGIFEAFDDYLDIPADYTGKNTHTYLDDKMTGVLVDYQNVPCEYSEESGIHLEKAEYSLSISKAYLEYIKGVRTIER